MTELDPKEVDALYETLEREAEASGYHLNPDREFTRALMEGLTTNVKRYGYQACPCRRATGTREDDLDIICPCDYRDADLGEYGACYCALYVSKDVVVGTITVDNHKSRRPITQEQTAILERFTEYAGIAIMNAKLYMRAVEAQNELKHAHEKLIETEQLKTIERMVATVNHEINNPLCSILLSAQMLQTMLAAGDEALKQKAKSILENADRIASIVSKLENIQRTAPSVASTDGKMFDLDEMMSNLETT